MSDVSDNSVGLMTMVMRLLAMVRMVMRLLAMVMMVMRMMAMAMMVMMVMMGSEVVTIAGSMMTKKKMMLEDLKKN